VEFTPGLHVIYGESGVGKTNFIRQLIGLPFAGKTNFTLDVHAKPEPVQMILQNPENQIVSPTIKAELAFSLECFEKDNETIQARIKGLKKKLLFSTDWNRHPITLSGGEKELLNIVTGFSTPAKLIVIDDGLSFLNERYKQEIVDQIKKEINQNNLIVLWFTSEYSDLRFGHTANELTLSSFANIESYRSLQYPKSKMKPGRMSVTSENLTFGYDNIPLLKKVTMRGKNIRSLGLIGLNGSGKTTLAAIMLGLLKPSEGRLKIDLGTNSEPAIGYLDQFPERLLGADTLSNFLVDLEKEGKLVPAKRVQCLKTLLNYQVNWNLIKDRYALDIPWSALRLALIIILTHCEYDILILDEPTFGLGWEQRLILYRYLHKILLNKHLIIVSHDNEFVNYCCDFIFSLDDQSLIRKEKVYLG